MESPVAVSFPTVLVIRKLFWILALGFELQLRFLRLLILEEYLADQILTSWPVRA